MAETEVRGGQEPRVRPRVPVEDLVDRRAHPPRRPIRTTTDQQTRPHWTTLVALSALGTFWLCLPLAGLLGPLVGLHAGLGLLGLAVSSLVVAYLLGSE